MHYTRCALCPGINLCIPPDGPENAELLFVGEAPGRVEQQKNRVFIGKTGEEVNGHYLPLAGLRREAVTFTNAIRCLPISSGGKLDPSRGRDLDLLDSCAVEHLYPYIERNRPKVIIPLGAFACEAICPNIELDLHHGMPTDTMWGIPAFPMYHPALGIHEPKKMLYIRTDWQRLRSYLNGRLIQPVDTYPAPDYQEVTDVDELYALDPTQPLACDTESTGRHAPFCLTYSQQPGTGRLVRADRADLLTALQTVLSTWQSPILFHNWLYDWSIVEAMGLQFPHRYLVDTMQRVYHLGNLPQGLKALAYRELGMRMQDFDDLVAPYSAEKIRDYFYVAQTVEWGKPDEQLVQDEIGKWKLYKPQGMGTKLKRFFSDLTKNPEKDVFQAWDNWEGHQSEIEAECGPYPGKCITHVPFEQVLYYACRDADATLRLWPILQRMSTKVRKLSQEHWRVA